ncbi:hypothetical protein Mapa_000318 [Marchantia paleacea]|nr:hypothetical protein Mapa_000318 [Marchantia paleacea]
MWAKCSSCVKKINSWGKTKAVALTAPNKGIKAHSVGLPKPLPTWAPGTGFASGRLNLGELEIVQVVHFEEIWRSGVGDQGATYYKPVIPDGFFSFGSYGQLNRVPSIGWTFAVTGSVKGDNPILAHPTDYTLLWSSAVVEAQQEVYSYFWSPVMPAGYKNLGYLVTTSASRPPLEDMVCVREDLTETCQLDEFLWDSSSVSKDTTFSTWTTKPYLVGIVELGIAVNTVYCATKITKEIFLPVRCLKNVHRVMTAMPTYEQLLQIMQNYGPTVYFHPNEEFLPASPNWYFSQGALLYSKAAPKNPVRVEKDGANLPAGGSNDDEYWLALPNDGTAEKVKKGDLASAKGFLHVKPMFGGSFTDIACWIFYTFNGSSTAKVGILKNLSLGRIGEHVCDWEHFTVRVDNFSGEMRRLYMAAHAAGTWWRPHEIEFVPGTNRGIVYSARNTHAMYPHEGENLQGDDKVGIGIRNDTSKSNVFLDTSVDYEFIAVDYRGTKGAGDDHPQTDLFPASPPWVDYMREWGPKIEYDSKSELDKVLKYLPALLRNSVMSLLKKLPDELGGQEGPTGPKEKVSWAGDERLS